MKHIALVPPLKRIVLCFSSFQGAMLTPSFFSSICTMYEVCPAFCGTKTQPRLQKRMNEWENLLLDFFTLGPTVLNYETIFYAIYFNKCFLYAAYLLIQPNTNPPPYPPFPRMSRPPLARRLYQISYNTVYLPLQKRCSLFSRTFTKSGGHRKKRQGL